MPNGSMGTAMMKANGKDDRSPFRPNTVKKTRKAGIIPFVDGGQGQIDLPRVGYLSGVWINLRGTLNLGAAGAFADLGPWNILRRLQITANFGGASLWDTSGYMCYLSSNGAYYGFLPDAGDSRSLTPPTDVYQAGLTMGNNIYSLWYFLPLAINQGLNFDIGLILLQSTTVTLTVSINFGNAAGDLVASLGGGTGFSGTAHIYYDYYEVPAGNVKQPPLIIVRTLEESQVITATGETKYETPNGGTLVRMDSLLRLNSLRSDNVDYVRLYLNETETRFDIERQLFKALQRREGGMHLTTGAFRWDFLNAFASGVMSVGDSQNAIDTEEIAELEFTFFVPSGLGASGNEIRFARRIIQVIQ